MPLPCRLMGGMIPRRISKTCGFWYQFLCHLCDVGFFSVLSEGFLLL